MANFSKKYQTCFIFSQLLLTFLIYLPDIYDCQNLDPDFKIGMNQVQSQEYGTPMATVFSHEKEAFITFWGNTGSYSTYLAILAEVCALGLYKIIIGK